jgi:hypothetical protein
MSDIAYDILGPFLASRKERPYYVVFEYFERHGMNDPELIIPEILCRCFRILLRGFIRKELTLIRGLENPQIKNLKRRIKDILAGSDYSSKVWPGDKSESCYWAENEAHLRGDCPSVTGDPLYELVKDAFMQSCTRTEWCLQAFRLLDKKIEYRNAVKVHDLISTMIAVNAEFVDAAGQGTWRIPTPVEDYIDKRMSAVIDETITWVESEVLSRFSNKGRISRPDIALILKASRHYLEDFGLDGKPAEIPKYFQNLKPGLSQNDFQKQYKYILETAINQGLREFQRRLRKELTIHPFGNY